MKVSIIEIDLILENISFSGKGASWTLEQSEAFNKVFALHLSKGKCANANEIRDAMEKYPCLLKKGAATLRTRFSNIFSQHRKKMIKDVK